MPTLSKTQPRHAPERDRAEMFREIERCVEEQRACREYLGGDGPDKEGAWMGLQDWQMEEAILRAEIAAELGDTPRPRPVAQQEIPCREIIQH